MLQHYLKIAFRSQWKYKSQTLISLLGLAVGFTCFALATLWIRYEMTYDSFHENVKQMYVVYRSQMRNVNYPLASYLKETFPEIANAATVIPASGSGKVSVEGVDYPARTIRADSSFFKIFNVTILEGSREFLVPDSRKCAITREKSRQLFGKENPIGKMISDDNEICAIVSDMSKHSDYAFDFIRPFNNYILDPRQAWRSSSGENLIIELLPGTNVEAFEKKLFELEIKEGINYKNLTIKPITKIRHVDYNVVRNAQLRSIFMFALYGLLIFLCSIFNYLTLFISRFRLRQKELTLRMVFGSSGRSLLSMMSVEFLLTMSLSILLASLLTEFVYDPFRRLSGVQMGLPAIYRELFLYVSCIILLSLLMFWLILYIFRRRSRSLSIRSSNTKLFRKSSVIVQLIISIGFTFCTIIILKQIYFLHNTNELGFSFKNSGSILIVGRGHSDVLANHLKQIPEITETVDTKGIISLLPMMARLGIGVNSWDNKPADAENLFLSLMFVSPEYVSFYELSLLSGDMLTKADPDTLVLLNETAVKKFGWDNPVGKQFSGKYTVKGVIKNIYNLEPTRQGESVCYANFPQSPLTWQATYGGTETVLFKYQKGTWKACLEKIKQLVARDYPDLRITIYNTEEEYDKFLKNENLQVKILSFASVICVLVCVFGFVSLVSLTCEERRKSIAIHKINGATVGDIISIFAKEYSLLLIIGAIIAFSAGYFIMQRWLEQYVKQTGIPAWVYLSIIFVMALLIVLCVGWRVYRSSVENPAEVVKGN